MKATNSRNGNILIVDDQPVHLKILSVMLTKQGYHVRPAISGKVALRAAFKAPPDLIILDVMMPDIGGFEVCQTLKANDATRDIPIIFVSALNEVQDKIKAFEAGGVDYITKPFQVEEVLARVDTHLTLQNMRRHLEEKNAELEREIEERKQAQESLRKLSRAVEQSASPIIITNLEGVIEFVNPAFTKITGYSFAEALGQKPDILKSGEHSPEFYKTLWHTITSGEVWEGELRNRRKDGGLFWERAIISPIKDAEGETTHFLAIKENITERKQMEAALEKERALLADRVAEQTIELRTANAELSRALRVKGEFLANMSHELRTPLNAILGMAEILKDGVYGSLNEHQLNSIRLIDESGRHLLELINDILDISKIEAGKLELVLDQVSVPEVCQASVRFVQQAATKKNLEISTNLETDANMIIVDERRLKQILVNLLSNAVKFTPAYGKIGLDVTVDQANEAIRFTVWDTGIGIAEKEMERLFEPFVQLDSSLSRQHEGTGLGLSLVYRLTDMHGGSVTVESEEGQGTSFVVSLPLHLLPGNNNHQPPLDNTWQGRPSNHLLAAPQLSVYPNGPLILLAEDNENASTILQYHLRQGGYQVLYARSGIEAIERAKKEKPHLILMDVQMPALGGLEAIRQLRSDNKLPRTPIIAVTSLAIPGDRERCLKAGADAYITKPISFNRLTQTINQFF